MLVWRNNLKKKVRTVRHRINDKVIDFNSIIPPPKLLIHDGKWVFEEHEERNNSNIRKNVLYGRTSTKR
jgi:hypothetical protein